MSDVAPKLDVPVKDFVSVLKQKHDTPARELLKPYLQYELWLRKAFARGDVELDELDNLIEIYPDGDESSLRIRNIDRTKNDAEKYIMRLPDDLVQPEGKEAVVLSFEGFMENFTAFTHGVFANFENWNNVVIAGSSALLPLLSRRIDIAIEDGLTGDSHLQNYYQEIASSSDIDLFLYGLDEDEARDRILELEADLRKAQGLSPTEGITLRTEHALTFISPRYPFRHIQVILRLYKSISEVLTGFDVDCACVAFDGEQVYSNPRGVAAIATRTNTIDLSRRSPSYENRLYKYRNHNFDVYWDALERSRVTAPSIDFSQDLSPVYGLSRLLFFETLLEKIEDRWILQQMRKRRRRKIEDSREPIVLEESGYYSVPIPYSERYTAERIRAAIEKRASIPLFFGKINAVIYEGAKKTKKNQGKVSGPIAFIKDDPGRQMIGSFYPLTDDDWAKSAYV